MTLTKLEDRSPSVDDLREFIFAISHDLRELAHAAPISLESARSKSHRWDQNEVPVKMRWKPVHFASELKGV